jgi:transcriptional regulator with XRE-family HTH domain
MFSDLLRTDRERSGLTVEQAARRLSVLTVAYRELEAGERWPSWETYDRIAAAFGWPQTFAATRSGSRSGGKRDGHP